ncbi:glycoside hydrolase domain-containing protein [Streptomyces sp. L7]
MRRYLSWLPNPKVLTLSEAHALTAADLGIVSNWESDGLQDWQSGVPSDPYAQGAGHATEAQRQALANGMPSSRPIYFSVDFDLQSSMYSALNSYFDGVASVIGRSRTGAYGGYHVIKELFDNGENSLGLADVRVVQRELGQPRAVAAGPERHLGRRARRGPRPGDGRRLRAVGRHGRRRYRRHPAVLAEHHRRHDGAQRAGGAVSAALPRCARSPPTGSSGRAPSPRPRASSPRTV